MVTLASLCLMASRERNVAAAEKRGRIAQALLAAFLVLAFAAVCGRVILFALPSWEINFLAVSAPAPAPVLAKPRPDITDRNGRILATDIRMYWLAADPRLIGNADDAAEKLAALFPELSAAVLAERFRNKASRFEWVKRGLTPKQAEAAHDLGIPGLTLLPTNQRVYPAGNEAAHLVGVVNIDNEGLSGIEWYIDQKLSMDGTPTSLAERPIVKLSIDLGVQHVLAEELREAMRRYHTEAALGLVLDVRSGEVLASASLPDFDPNRREQTVEQNRQNRVVTDVYELGSVFKTFTIAMALDEGVAQRYERFDASPVRIGHFLLRDPHAKKEPMTVEDIFIHSSNTGTARIAMAAGMEKQQRFLRALSLFDKIETEAGMSPKPVFPKIWRPANATTIAYGHGIAVSPLLFASAFAAVANGGMKISPTFLLAGSNGGDTRPRVLSERTSETMRNLMRLVVQRGTGRRAAVAGLDVGGKTGTALKVKEGRYTHDVINTFVAVLPVHDPKYLVMVTLDEPKPEAPGQVNEAAHNAAPTAGAIVKRIAPMLDILPTPRFDEAAATPYEQAVSDGPKRAAFRKNPYETRGSDREYSAFGEREPAPEDRYPGDHRR